MHIYECDFLLNNNSPQQGCSGGPGGTASPAFLYRKGMHYYCSLHYYYYYFLFLPLDLGINNPEGFTKLSYAMQKKLEWPLVLLLCKVVM